MNDELPIVECGWDGVCSGRGMVLGACVVAGSCWLLAVGCEVGAWPGSGSAVRIKCGPTSLSSCVCVRQ
jgi:hypothetical protein